MKFPKQKFILKTLFFALFFILQQTNVFAGLSIETVVTGKTKAPQNSTKVKVLFFKIIGVTTSDQLHYVKIKNNSPTINFGIGVKGIYLYKDNGDETFAADQDTLLKDIPFTVSSLAPQEFILADDIPIATNTATGFFICYDIDASAIVGFSTNVELVEVKNNNSQSATVSTNVNTLSHNLTITGLKVQTAQDISPTVVIPGEENIKMLKISLQTIGENLSNNDISLTIKNDENNFANVADSTSGVIKVDLYKDSNTDGELSGTDSLLKSISGTSFASTSEAIFSSFPTNAFTLTQGVTTNLFVVYTIGKNTPISATTKIKSQLTAFNGIGSESGLQLTLSSATPIVAATASIVGVSYGNLESIVPPTNKFGPGTTAPILKFKLTAQNLAVTINKITLQNNGNIKYITNSSQTNGVTKISLFEDTNKDGNYDGANYGDTLIGELALGHGAGQTNKSAPIPISFSSPNIGLYIATNDIKTIFVTYDLGSGISISADTSGNVTSKAYCVLEDAAGSTNASIYPINLSGALPVSSNPLAEVLVQPINLRIISVDIISPTIAVRGQEKVPMLYLKLTSDANISSATIQILNNKNTLFDNNTGVSKIWLYNDKNQNKIYDSSDTFLAAATTFSEPLRTYLPKFDIPQGENYLLVLYDIGIEAGLTLENMACQVENIISTGNATTILLGADLPLPKNPALVTAETNLLKINKITCTTTNITNNSSSFNIEIEIENSSTKNIKIKELSPRLYFNAKNGTDISYEFKMANTANFPITLNAGAIQNFKFSLKPDNLSSEGMAYIDGFLTYQVSSENYAVLHRYKTSGSKWTLTVADPPQIQIITTKNIYSWQSPSYIASVNIEIAGKKSVFQNFDSVPAHSALYIYIKDKAQYLDEASLEVILSNSVTVNRKILIYELKNQSTDIYEFNREEGYLKILDLGTTSGELTINLKDVNGNTLASTKLNFYIAAIIEIHDAFFYPNPYLSSKSGLKLGFRITQPADINIYLYNMLGELVWTYETTYSSLGYEEISWDAKIDGKLISSGIYLAKIMAEDTAGNKTYVISRLAVY